VSTTFLFGGHRVQRTSWTRTGSAFIRVSGAVTTFLTSSSTWSASRRTVSTPPSTTSAERSFRTSAVATSTEWLGKIFAIATPSSETSFTTASRNFWPRVGDSALTGRVQNVVVKKRFYLARLASLTSSLRCQWVSLGLYLCLVVPAHQLLLSFAQYDVFWANEWMNEWMITDCRVSPETSSLSSSTCGLSLNGRCCFHEWPSCRRLAHRKHSAEMSLVACQANAGKLGGQKPDW